jgi:hypothetical protein
MVKTNESLEKWFDEMIHTSYLVQKVLHLIFLQKRLKRLKFHFQYTMHTILFATRKKDPIFVEFCPAIGRSW